MDKRKIFALMSSLNYRLCRITTPDEVSEEYCAQDARENFTEFSISSEGKDRSIGISIKSFNDILIVNISTAYLNPLLDDSVRPLNLHIYPVKIYPINAVDEEEIIRTFNTEYKKIKQLEETLRD